MWWGGLRDAERRLWLDEAQSDDPQKAWEVYQSRTRPLTQDELDVLSSGHCPRCKQRGFVIGPAGGASLNIECANVNCRERWNIVWMSGRAIYAHALPNGVTSQPWPSEPKASPPPT